MASFPVFSPSQTQRWLQCPRKWSLDKTWELPKPFTPEKLIGEAIHAGLASRFTPVPLADALDVMQLTLEAGWQGGDIDDFLETGRQCLTKAYALDIPGTVITCEKEMGPERCRPDLVTVHGQGEEPCTLGVIDWKYKGRLESQWVARELNKYKHSWQLWHYAWRVQEEYNIPVTQFSVVLIIGHPRPNIRRIDVPVTQDKIDVWLNSAKHVWRQMSNIYNIDGNIDGAADAAYANYESCDRYGGCDFLRACHELNLDERKMDSIYLRKEPKT